MGSFISRWGPRGHFYSLKCGASTDLGSAGGSTRSSLAARICLFGSVCPLPLAECWIEPLARSCLSGCFSYSNRSFDLFGFSEIVYTVCPMSRASNRALPGYKTSPFISKLHCPDSRPSLAGT